MYRVLPASGNVSGTVPQDFNHGGGEVRFWDPIQGVDSIVHSSFFDVNAPFRIEGGENGQIEIGDQWTNSRMQYNVFVNTQGDLSYIGQSIPPNTIKLSDGKFYSFDDFEQMRDGRGIEVAGSQFNDYIDLSGFSITDFNQMGWWHYTDFYKSPTGNDYWHAPAFKVEGEFVGQLDARDFYTPFIPWDYTPDADADALTFTFKENGYVTVKSSFGLYNFDSVTEAHNIEMVTTNKTTNDTVYGDSSDNHIILSGGSDLVYGNEGKDEYAIGYHDDALQLDVRLADYQEGELIRLWDFPLSSDAVSSGTLNVVFDVISGQTHISVNAETYSNRIIKVDGFWAINQDSVRFDGDGVQQELSFTLEDPTNIPGVIEGTDRSDFLAAFGDPQRYDEGSQFITKDLEIRGYEGLTGLLVVPATIISTAVK